VTEQLRARLVPVRGVRPAAAVAGADDRILRAEDVLLHFRIAVAVDRLETGLQVLIRAMVEEPDRARSQTPQEVVSLEFRCAALR
jgi:hypothetical protein